MIAHLNKYIGTFIKRAFINAESFWLVNEGSGDCDEIIIETEKDYILFKHTTPGECGITAEFVPNIGSGFTAEVDLSTGNYRFYKVIYDETGYLDTVVFKSENEYLHIFTSQHELIVTKSILDLSADVYFEDIPEEDPTVLLL